MTLEKQILQLSERVNVLEAEIKKLLGPKGQAVPAEPEETVLKWHLNTGKAGCTGKKLVIFQTTEGHYTMLRACSVPWQQRVTIHGKQSLMISRYAILDMGEEAKP